MWTGIRPQIKNAPLSARRSIVMKKNNLFEGMTKEQILSQLKEIVKTHNESEDAAEKGKLKAKADHAVEEYNNASKLDAYAECLAAENSMLTFIKKYEYPVISTKLDKSTDMLSIKETVKPDSPKKTSAVFNLWDFVAFCEGTNRQVTASLDWKVKAAKAKNILTTELNRYIDEGGEMNVGLLKDALQAMTDAVVMVAGKAGNNAVIITSKKVRTLYTTSGRLNIKTRHVDFARDTSWQGFVLAMLNSVVENKEFTFTYGDPDDTTATEDETKTDNTEENKTDAPAEQQPATTDNK